MKTVYLLAMSLVVTTLPQTAKARNWSRLDKATMMVYGDSRGGGTGFRVLGPDNKVYVMTAAHVCAISVTGVMLVEDEEEHYRREKIVKIDIEKDLCFITSKLGPYLRLSLAEPNQGSLVFSSGFPGLYPGVQHRGGSYNEEESHSILISILDKNECSSHQGRLIQLPTGERGCKIYRTMIETDMSVMPGQSGSAVVNEADELVGLVSAYNEEDHHGSLVPYWQLKEFFKTAP